MGEGVKVIKIAVKIKPKKDVLDSAGRSILALLKNSGSPIEDCRYGKYIELSINEKEEKKALLVAQKTVEDILHNSLVEEFELEVLSD